MGDIEIGELENAGLKIGLPMPPPRKEKIGELVEEQETATVLDEVEHAGIDLVEMEHVDGERGHAEVEHTELEGMNELVRYDRQKKIWGEEGQIKLENAVVTIIGADYGAYYAALPLVALGVGEVRIIGTGKMKTEDRVLDMRFTGKERVLAYERGFKMLNPNTRVIGIPVDLETRLAQDFLQKSSVIIDTTNNPKSKMLALEFAKNRYGSERIPFITTGISNNYAKMMIWQGEKMEVDHLMTHFSGFEQHPLLALLWGGVISEEVKKIILTDATRMEFPRALYYKRGVEGERFSFRRLGEMIVPQNIPSEKKEERELYADKRVLVIGAGALGNIMTLALSTMGIGEVDYLDYDTIESHNLNRQVLFYDAVGKEKAGVLAQKHHRMDPSAKTRALVERFERKEGTYSIDTYGRGKYDAIFDLVDNLYARALISAYATERDIALISAASSPDAAQVAVYVPGKSSCMNHVFSDYYERGRQEEIIRRQSCIAQPDPSVIMTNQVGAALAALELGTLFDGQRYGLPLNGSIKYATDLDSRLGFTALRSVCDCYVHKERIPNLEI